MGVQDEHGQYDLSDPGHQEVLDYIWSLPVHSALLGCDSEAGAHPQRPNLPDEAITTQALVVPMIRNGYDEAI